MSKTSKTKNKKLPKVDSLQGIFLVQKDFQKNFYIPSKMSVDEKVALSKEYILSAHKELSEILDELPWKTHRKYDSKNIDKDKLLLEIVDAVKFIMNLCIIWGIDWKEFLGAFMLKSLRVKRRFNEEKSHIKHL